MKVRNMTGRTGKPVANQFIVEWQDDSGNICVAFQSYTSLIAVMKYHKDGGDTRVTLDRDTWNFSRTTSKYRSEFLNEGTADTQRKIDSGEYFLDNLN